MAADQRPIESFLSDSDVAVSCAFCFLSAEDLAAASMASTMWKTTARLDLLWLNLARARWHDKQNHRLTPARLQNIRCSRECVPCFERYAAAERDARRITISRAELCSIDWRFSDGLQRPRFKVNGDLCMELYPVLHWSFTENGSIMIEKFPEHTVHRTPDWGWVIRNENVSFISHESMEYGEKHRGTQRATDKKNYRMISDDSAMSDCGSEGHASSDEDCEDCDMKSCRQTYLDDTVPLPSDATREDVFMRFVALRQRKNDEETGTF